MGDSDQEQENNEGSFEGDSDTEATDNEYYSFLNVPRNAPETDINAAYKKLTRLYHPDKHQDPQKKAQAELLFSKLKLAHEVLSDPHKRAIYDCLGKAGLREQGWEIVQRTKTPREIREEYEALARVREERRLQQRTNPTSRFQMTVDATDLFDRYLYDSEYDDLIDSSLPHLEVSEISLAQSIQAPLTTSDTATLSGNLSTTNGTGNGSVSCGIRRVTSAAKWQEVEFSVGNGATIGGKMYRKLTARTFVNMSGSLQLTSRGLKPVGNISLGNQLDQHTVGYLTYSTNWRVFETNDAVAMNQEQSGMATMVVRDTEKYHAIMSLQLGIPFTYVMLAYTRKMAEAKQKVRVALKAGTFGAMLEYGIEKKITDHSSLGATIVIGIPVGVTLRVKLTRASQTYLFPFHLSDEILLQPIFYGTVTPLLAWFTLKKLILDPYQARKKEKDREKTREANKERVADSKREAEASINLMRERFSRIKSDEETKGGLVIVNCIYGQLADEKGELLPNLSTWDGGTEDMILNGSCIDITLAIQCLVEESRMQLWEGSKSSLPGVWDPCPGEGKWILIQYLYQNVKHQTFCPEEDAVKLPKNSHRISSVNS